MQGTSARPLLVADDFGLSPSVDRAVIELARAGAIDAVSVLVTGAGGLPPRLAELRRIPGIAVGLHLSFTWGVPLTPGLARRAGGRFPPLPLLLVQLARRRVSPAAARAEVEAQWRRLELAAGRVDHVDGHEHVHLLPVVFDALCAALRARRSRRRVRFAPLSGGARTRDLAVGCAVRWQRARRRLAGAELPFVNRPQLVDLGGSAPGEIDGAAEVMVHAAHPDCYDPQLARSSFPYQRRVEQYRRLLAATAAAADGEHDEQGA